MIEVKVQGIVFDDPTIVSKPGGFELVHFFLAHKTSDGLREQILCSCIDGERQQSPCFETAAELKHGDRIEVEGELVSRRDQTKRPTFKLHAKTITFID